MNRTFINQLSLYKNRFYDHLAKRVGGCVLCGRSTDPFTLSPRICEHCAQTIGHPIAESDRFYRCHQCAHLMTTDEPLCGECLTHPPKFNHSLAFADYNGQLQRALLKFKFHRALHLAPLLADALRHALPQYAQRTTPDYVILVPQITERLQQRGFHPLRLIMQQIDLHDIWPDRTPEYVPNALLRVHHDQLQIHVKPDMRRKQVKGAFALNAGFLPQERHILVIDDIITTGATLNEIAHTLKKSGAQRVDNVLIARTTKGTNA